MADKNSYPLRLLLTAVDRISGPIDSINKKIAPFSAEATAAGNALASIGQTSGLARLEQSLGRVGKAAGNVWSEASALGKRLVIGGSAFAFGAYEFTQHAVDSGAALAFQSKRLKVGVDDFAAYTFAARKAGIQNEDFAAGLDFFQKARGQAEAGKGSLHGLLQSAWPDLLKQITAAKGTIPALDLVVKGMERLRDPEKRSALAAAAFGRGAMAMANLADLGAAGIAKLRTRYLELTGTQANFAERSRSVVEAESDLDAAWTGTRNALLEPLFPVLQDQLERFSTWLVGHREDVRAWGRTGAQALADFAEGLPARLASIASFARNTQSALQPIADLVGGWPTLFATVGAGILAGPLIGALATLTSAVVSLGIAIGFTPIGWFAAGLAAIGISIVGLTALYRKLNEAQDDAAKPREFAAPSPFRDARAFFRGEERLRASHGTEFDQHAAAFGQTSPRGPAVPAFASDSAARDFFGGSPIATSASHAPSDRPQPITSADASGTVAASSRLHPDDIRALADAFGEKGLTVDFRNVPRGTRVMPSPGSAGLNLGVSMAESH